MKSGSSVQSSVVDPLHDDLLVYAAWASRARKILRRITSIAAFRMNRLLQASYKRGRLNKLKDHGNPTVESRVLQTIEWFPEGQITDHIECGQVIPFDHV